MTNLFYDVLKASFQGSIVILAVLALRLLLKKAPKSLFCLLWLLAGLRLVLPFEIRSSLSLQPEYDFAPQTQWEQVEQGLRGEILDQHGDVLVEKPLQPDPFTMPEGNLEDVQSESFLYKVEDGVITGPVHYGDIAAPIWLLGLAVMLSASAVSYLKLKRRVREAWMTENGCFECPGLETAFVLGFMSPKIYLPLGLSEQEKKFIYDHENTHIDRNDHWFKLLGYLVLSIHWFNPLVWLAYHLLCRDMEQACDERVVRNMTLPERKAYSAALLSCSSNTARLAACQVAFGESNPKKRIVNVLNYKRPTFWIILLAVAAVIFVSVCLLTSPEAKEDAPEAELIWNLEMQVTNVTPSGLTVEFIQHGDFPDRGRATLQFGTHYTLERMENGQWVEAEMLPQEYAVAWTSEAYMIEIGKTTTRRESWEWLYGELPAGHYRIGKDVDLFRMTGDYDSEMFWAEFDIRENAENIAQCREAFAQWSGHENYLVYQHNSYYGSAYLNSSADINYLGSGEDWLYIAAVPDADNGRIFYRMKKDGVEYQQELYDTLSGNPEGWSWFVAEDVSDCMDGNWFGQFRWDDSTIRYEGSSFTDGKKKVTLLVVDDPSAFGQYAPYTAEFTFDDRGAPVSIKLTLDEDDIRYKFVSVYIVDNTVDASAEINAAYAECLAVLGGEDAIERVICNDPDCIDTTHDHYGIACTVEHCTNPAHGHGDEHHD